MLLAYFFPLCSQFGDALIQTVHFFQCFIPLAGQLMELLALALILAVAGKDFLLLADEVGRADRLFRCIRVGDQLLGKVLFRAASWPVKVRLSYRALSPCHGCAAQC